MATEETTERLPSSDEEHNPLYEAARKVLLASIGAVALAQEEIEDFINKLVERGEFAEKDGKKLFHELMERRKKDAEKTEDEIVNRVEEALDRMNIASKSDLDALSKKISSLAKMIDDLKKPQA
jgi:poly(hydroxyalkanoate) granule-associated protein